MKSFRKFEFLKENGSHSEIEILGCDNHDLFGVGCWNVFPDGRPPLKHGMIQERK
jgi:hypothetical protein